MPLEHQGYLLLLLAAVPAPAQQPTLIEVHRLLPAQEPHAGAISVSGDVDGDGRADLLTVHPQGRVAWRATADDRFEPLPGALPPHPDTWKAMVLADVDGDGDLDCLTATRDAIPTTGEGLVLLFVNNGSGTFTAAQNAFLYAFIAFDLYTSLAAGDVDGDGDVDVLAGVTLPATLYPWSGRNRLFVNNGSGIFTEVPAQLPPHQDATTVVVLADFDGDGDRDAFCGNDPGATATPDRLYTNNGTGTFAHAPAALPADTRRALAAYARDFDLDGDVDLLVHDVEGFRLLVNNGAASFTHVVAATPSVSGSESFAADFDLDGRVDYAVHSGSNLHFLANTGGAFVQFVHQPARTLAVGDGYLAAVDFESDGDVDFIASGTSADARVFRNDGTGTYSKVGADLPPGLIRCKALGRGDIDGDGDLDIVGASGWGWAPERRVFRNDGNGFFTSVAAGDFTLELWQVMDLALGDVDGDGDLDIVTAGATSALYRNTGGSFLRVAFPQLAAGGVALGDLDGDSDLDAFLITQTQAHIALNQGGVFTLLGALPVFQALDVALVDVDGDNDLDAVIVDYPNRLMLNNGAGTFTESVGAFGTTTAGFYNSLTLFDCDGDLDVDVVFNPPSWSSGQSLLWRNNGSGAFLPDYVAMPANTVGVWQGASLDVDADGDQDFIGIATINQGGTRLFANNGSGVFSLVPNGIAPTPDSASCAAVGDFDGDGDLDVLLGDMSVEPHLHRNARQQVAWVSLPRIGHLLHVDVRGRANEPFILGASLVPASLPIPGLGTLRLDPGWLQVMAFGAFDTAGRASFQAPVPNAPVLIGVSIYWQALSGTVLQLGNLEVTTLLAH